MMKRILVASAAMASLAALAAPAYADPTTVTFNLDGNVPATCNLGGMIAAEANTINVGGSAGASIISSTTGKLDVSTLPPVSLGANWCNGTNTSVTVTATPLTTKATAPSGFSNRVDYTITGTFAGQSSGSLDTATTSTEGPVPIGAFNDASDVLDIALDTNPNLLVAGDYKGSIVIVVTPG
jgi:hypothetical protein